jgi:type II secretory pathway component GspD/PulD (secretin)
MTRRGNLVTIVPKTKVFDIDAPIVDPENPEVQAGDVIITRIFELEHIETASAQSLLTGMKLGVSVSPIASIRTLIVSGYAYRMERIESLLDMIDKPGEQKKFRSRTLEYTTAKTLSTKVKALAEQLGTVSITISVPTPTTPARPTVPGRRTPTPPRTPTRPTTPSPTTAPAKPSVYLDADERTNRILMIGLEEQLAIVDKLIDTLDVEQKILRSLRLYEIQHVDAEEIRTKLSELGIVSGGGRASSVSSRTPTRTPTIPGRTPPAPRTPTRPTTPSTTGAIQEPLAEEPQVVIIESSNSLLVNGTEEQHVQIAIIIGYVDTGQDESQNPYVIYPLENQEPEELAATLEKLIQETITEKSATDSKVVRTSTKKKIDEDIFIVPDPKSYSLIVYASKKNQQWLASLIKELDEYRPQVLLDVTLVEISKNDQFTLDLQLVSKFPRLAGGETMDFFTALLDNPLPDKRIIETVSTSGAGSGFYADEHVQALLTAMQTKDYGRVMARPKLLVNDNEEGTIKAETITTVVSPKSQVVPGTGVTGPSQATSVELSTYTEGITLTITPHISKGDQLRLTVAVTRTDFGLRPDYSLNTPEGNLTGPTPPDLLTSDVTSTVTVPDKSTIILGGLEKLKQTKGGTKIPIIGDLPIIGGLFRSTANNDIQSRLYVFVKANILRPGEESAGISDLEVVSLKNRRTFEKFEEEMQEYEDWPGIKPKPMDPLKVLEAEEEVSLRDRKVFEQRERAIRESRNSTGSKSKAIDPMRVLELN